MMIPPRCDSTLTGVGYIEKCALEFGHAEPHRAMTGKEWNA